MTHTMDARFWLAGLLTLSASLAVVAAERLSDLDLSQMYGSTFQNQVLETQNEWRSDGSNANWRASDDDQTGGRIEFGYDEIREHQRVQEMLEQSTHDFRPSAATVLQYQF
ncbi:hypothetical protein [Marinobacter zhejiangensis]|uniref:Porin n=1 Tax=Marinobacter zhejiangensis TaxID=488535 RepID=A0A1I4LRI5_9GAMM|nr:hypothetical protein [Marinobacter zhejiangensis]SFL93423.1 hypothetical protein SAMN04487963_0610 [Marinobacter zhejiangensis]